jgi:hypothetical protein
MLYVQAVTRAAQQYRKHARGMDQFHGGIHGKESHGFRARMLLFPAPHAGKREVLHFFIYSIERSFELFHIEYHFSPRTGLL